MARWHPKSCRVCGTQASEDEPISARGYCLQHGLERMNANNRQLSPQTFETGPYLDHWRRRCIESLGGQLPDRELG